VLSLLGGLFLFSDRRFRGGLFLLLPVRWRFVSFLGTPLLLLSFSLLFYLRTSWDLLFNFAVSLEGLGRYFSLFVFTFFGYFLLLYFLGAASLFLYTVFLVLVFSCLVLVVSSSAVDSIRGVSGSIITVLTSSLGVPAVTSLNPFIGLQISNGDLTTASGGVSSSLVLPPLLLVLYRVLLY